MIKSMTAFARTEQKNDKQTIVIEIRSLNSRYLDISLRMPQSCLSLEAQVKKKIRENVMRGRIETTIYIKDEPDEASIFEVDRPRVKAYYEALNQIRNELQIKSEITLTNLLGIGGIVKPVEIEIDTNAIWPAIENCFQEALTNLNSMRSKEGNRLAEDFASRIDHIEQTLNLIEKFSKDMPLLYQERLKERISLLIKDVIEIDPVRLIQEAAFIANRSDISEEIVRIRSHIIQFRDLINSDVSEGRKLNFLLQEFNREFNTIGSKTDNIEVSQAVVDVKSELEKIREQVQNVE
ncbi:putative endoribonuclease YicC [Candidatus Magnetomoraceae bacterium gMMP-1]